MFGIGFQEMIIILVVVLIVFGPKRLPDLARSLGKGLAEFKKASEEVRKGIEEAVEEENSKTPPKETTDSRSSPVADAAYYASANPEAGMDEALSPSPGNTAAASSNADTGSSPPGA